MSREPLRRICFAVTGALCLVVVISVVVPWSPGFPESGLDPSWRWAMNELYARQARFGTEVIHTYGPYAFMRNNEYHPEIHSKLLTGRVVLAVVFGLAAMAVAVGFLRQPLAVALWLAVFIPIATHRDTIYMVMPLLAWLLAAYGRGRLRIPLLAVLLPSIAMVSLSKFSFAVFATAAVVVIAGYAAVLAAGTGSAWFRDLRREGAATRSWELLGWVGWLLLGVVLFWIAAGQPLGDLSEFFASRQRITSAYTAAHAKPGPLWHVLSYAAATGFLLAVVAVSEIRRDRWRGVASSLLLAGFLFLTNKLSFTRHDLHAVNAAFNAASAALLFGLLVLRRLPGTRSETESSWRRWVVVGTAVTAVWVMGSAIATSMKTPSLAARCTGMPRMVVRQLWVATQLAGTHRLAERYEEAKAALRRDHPLPRLAGTVDIYPHDIARILAHDLEYRPRPVLQSYLACDPWLAGRNADHLAGPDGPDHIVFEVDPIDGHLPPLEDGASWPFLLSAYEPRGGERAALVLDRLERSARQSWGDWEVHSLQLGETTEIDLPPDTLVWASLEVDQTLVGRLAGLLFKAPRLVIDLHLADGGRRTHGFVPAMGRSGFLLSPLVETTGEIARLWEESWPDHLSGKRVQSLAIRPVPNATGFYRSGITLRVRPLEINR